jgi:hypothetical protein
MVETVRWYVLAMGGEKDLAHRPLAWGRRRMEWSTYGYRGTFAGQYGDRQHGRRQCRHMALSLSRGRAYEVWHAYNVYNREVARARWCSYTVKEERRRMEGYARVCGPVIAIQAGAIGKMGATTLSPSMERAADEEQSVSLV